MPNKVLVGERFGKTKEDAVKGLRKEYRILKVEQIEGPTRHGPNVLSKFRVYMMER